MKALLSSCVLVSISALPFCRSANAQSAATTADTILVNGQIYTADDDWAEALAIKAGVILAVGDNAAVQPLPGCQDEGDGPGRPHRPSAFMICTYILWVLNKCCGVVCLSGKRRLGRSARRFLRAPPKSSPGNGSREEAG